MIDDQDEQAARVIDRLAEMAPSVAAALGTSASSVVVKALLQFTARSLRRGNKADQLLHALRNISPTDHLWGEPPFGECKRVGKDPT